jgi:hypothetical protein
MTQGDTVEAEPAGFTTLTTKSNSQVAPGYDVDLGVMEMKDTTTRVMVLGSPNFLPDMDRFHDLQKRYRILHSNFQIRCCLGPMANNKQPVPQPTFGTLIFRLKYQDGFRPNEVDYHSFTALLIDKKMSGNS